MHILYICKAMNIGGKVPIAEAENDSAILILRDYTRETESTCRYYITLTLHLLCSLHPDPLKATVTVK